MSSRATSSHSPPFSLSDIVSYFNRPIGAAAFVSCRSSSGTFSMSKLRFSISRFAPGVGDALRDELSEVEAEEAGDVRKESSQSRWISGILMTVSMRRNIMPSPSRRYTAWKTRKRSCKRYTLALGIIH